MSLGRRRLLATTCFTAASAGCLSWFDDEQHPILGFVQLQNMDAERGYTVVVNVLEDGDTVHEETVHLEASVEDLDDPAAGSSIVNVEEGWSHEPAEYVVRARLEDDEEWAEVDVTEAARDTYYAPLYMTNRGNIGATFESHYDDPSRHRQNSNRTASEAGE